MSPSGATLQTAPVVLVTRPQGAAADSLCAELEAAGYSTVKQPLLELQALAELPPASRQRVLDLDLYQHVIFISANAVRFGMAQIEDLWPQLPVGLNWYAIGAATAKLLDSYGINAITPGALMTSEGLLAVAPLQEVQGQRVLIVKGEGGRDTLARELAARGATVDTLACYRRRVPELHPGALAAQIRDAGVAAILISSGEGLANLVQLLRPAETSKLAAVCLLVPSERVARMAQDAGFTQVVTADNASDVAMLTALDQWNNSSGE